MDYTVKFEKPYKFEGKECDSLDLSGMEKMTVQDLIDIQKNIGNETAAMYAMEMTTSFAQDMAVKATGKPVRLAATIALNPPPAVITAAPRTTASVPGAGTASTRYTRSAQTPESCTSRVMPVPAAPEGPPPPGQGQDG